MFRSLVFAFAVALTTTALGADWPAWRGPDGQGHAAESDLPLKWSATENFCWKMPLPDAGSSSPVILRDPASSSLKPANARSRRAAAGRRSRVFARCSA